MRLKPQHLQPVIMAGIMAFVMTAIITWLNLGFPPDYFLRWAKAFVVAWPLAAIAAFVAIPIAQRATLKILAWLAR
ncbi:MAG: DUF2798 domain-containing protein [Azoarcus sp.]|jgi:hypothetical protein|nr:DUF2798 domain-containing protein [Azoarcus sp.]